MIGLSKRAVVEGISNISDNWICYAFSGNIPSKEALFEFNPKDDKQLYTNCEAVFEMSSTLRADHIKFYGTGGVVPFKGVSDIDEGKGFKVIPNVINTDLNFKLFDRIMLSSGQLSLNEDVVEGNFVEYQFDPCVVANIEVEYNRYAAGKLEYHDGNDWVFLADIEGTANVASYAGPESEIYGIRIVATEDTNWRIQAIDVYAEGASSNARLKNKITWAVLLPSTAAGVGVVADTDYPFLYLPVGGPNEDVPMMLNTVEPYYGQEVKLLYFTLGSGLLEF